MKVTKRDATTIFIEGAQALDPITTYFHNHCEGQGSVTITCYARAWTFYWAAVGNQSIEQFFYAAENSYLLTKFLSNYRTATPKEMEYLTRILQAVKLAMVEADL